MKLEKQRAIGLALQGGGSWGAYTWGVLDAVLANPRLAITQLSGTSAGAINAAIVAGALARGSPQLAREKLESFWLRIADPAAADVLRSMLDSLGRHWRESLQNWRLAGEILHAPDPMGVNPLRSILAEHVDIEAIRGSDSPALFVTATNVRTGLPRVISNEAMSIDALLASACLPHLFPAVELEGEHYWDGGYAGNPTLWPMLLSGLAHDLILVQLVPERVEEIPLESPSIRRRVGEIVFNASLVAEMQALAAMRQIVARGHTPVTNLRLHRIGPPPAALLEEGSAADRGRAWLQRLNNDGQRAARSFLRVHEADLGERETLDIERVFFEAA